MPALGAHPRISKSQSPPVPVPSPSLRVSVQGMLLCASTPVAAAVTALAGRAAAVPRGTLLGP